MAGETAPAWPADKVERWPIERLRPYAKNARTHSPEQVAQIAVSMREWGWTNPLLVDETGEIIAGHGRIEAAKLLGLAEAPVMVARGWSPAQKRAYVLADNQLALNAGWDGKLLAAEVADLGAAEFDLTLLGFSAAQLRGMAGGKTDPDAAPPAPDEPVSRTGDVWILGEHRLLCGDCTKAEDVARVMRGETAVLMNTDPPYGVDYAAVKNGIPRSGFRDIQARGGDIENDNLTDGPALQAFLEAAIRAAVPHLIDRAAFYLWHPMLTQGTFFAAAAAADILIHRQIIWVKPHLVLTRSGMYHWKHELCFYGWRRGMKPAWYGSKGQTSVWEIGFDGGDRAHPTQKPIALFEPPIANHTQGGEVIYEPFSGSGSQIIAAEMTARRCYAIEIAPAYVDVAARRWEQFTGKDALLEATGRTFAEVARERNERPKTKADKAEGVGRIPRTRGAAEGRA